jgi:hypothetical protein
MGMKKQKGIRVEVLRRADKYDCTMDGVSSKYDKFVLIGEGIRNPDTLPSKDCPALVLIKREIMGSTYLHAEPLVQPKGKSGPMFGGNYINSCEARYPSQYPIPIHDRFED